MTSVIAEILVILFLLVLNGVFAMTEIAVVSARRARLRQLAKAGSTPARMALDLAESPNRFLSTVQIGITLVGILAGAFGGATIATHVGSAIDSLPGLEGSGRALGLVVVVLVITYLSLVIGELVPKRIGLGNPEGIAMGLARPMNALSKLANPLVKLLGFSTDILLRIMGVRQKKEVVTEEEVKGLMEEGLRAGAFQKMESDMVERVLGLDQLPVREIMTPRTKIIWLNRDDPHEVVWHKIVVSGHSWFPVYANNRDNPVGMISVKAIYANLAANVGVKLGDLMVPPMIVPSTQTAIQLLEAMKQSRKHMALVADEFGTIVGLVTISDIMEAIAGEFPSQEERSRPNAKRRHDGSWLIDAMIELEKLEEILPGFKTGVEVRDYKTLAGYVMKQFGRLPKEGETFEAQGYVFEVLDMDRLRVDKVLVMPAGKAGKTSMDGSGL